MTHPHHTNGASPSAKITVVAEAPELGVAIANVVRRAGHDVTHAHRWVDALDPSDGQPEAVLLCADGLNEEALDLCRRLRSGDTPPVVFFVTPRLGAKARNEALRAGASHVFEAPVDAEEVALRLHLMLSVTREVARARASALVDSETGLYNGPGLARRTRELTAEAVRARAALACVVIGVDLDDTATNRDAFVRCAEALRAKGRLSDIIGRVGSLEFVVLAPGTGGLGAVQLSGRLQSGVRAALSRELGSRAAGRVRVGHASMENLAYAPIESGELLARAVGAVRGGRQKAFFDWLPPAELERQVRA